MRFALELLQIFAEISTIISKCSLLAVNWVLGSKQPPSVKHEGQLLKSGWHLNFLQIRKVTLNQRRLLSKVVVGLANSQKHPEMLWLAPMKKLVLTLWKFSTYSGDSAHLIMATWKRDKRKSGTTFSFSASISCSSHLNLVLVWISLKTLIELVGATSHLS